jgi:hypothetical protein
VDTAPKHVGVKEDGHGAWSTHVRDLIALIILFLIFDLFATAEACRARFWIHQAAAYYRVAFGLSAAFVCGALGATFL